MLVSALSYTKLRTMGWEETLQVNVISTAYLAILLLPKLYATADEYGITPRLTLTSSGVHAHSKLTKEMLANGKPIEWLSTEKNVKGLPTHYQVSKLLEVFFVRELANSIKRRDNGQTKIIVNAIDPGLCHSGLARNVKNPGLILFMKCFKGIFARSAEVGSRTIVNGVKMATFKPMENMLPTVRCHYHRNLLEARKAMKHRSVYGTNCDILYKMSPETASIIDSVKVD
ncbi:unnamed protein product [Umbelopsis ramanniana]